MNHVDATAYVFLPFRMDPSRRLLNRDGRAIILKPKEFDTLLVLVEAEGRVVDKDDLVARVWPDTYVGDGSLAKNISVLRKALGEEVIETHRGRGYRIALPVSALSPVPAPEVSAAPPLMPTRPWFRRGVVFVSTAAVVLFTWFIGIRFFVINTANAHHSAANASANLTPIHSMLIEKEGGLDPLNEGFKLGRPDGGYTHIMRNTANTGFDRWRLMTRDQNFYYRALSDAEKRFLLQHDWKLTCVCALEKGGGASDIDLGPGLGPRFDMAYLQEGSKYFVVLTTQISPHYEFARKIEFPGVADVDHPHTYELRYDHVTQTASLWIDGQQKASGYRGHRQYQENYGLMLGAATYRDVTESSMVFRSVRLQAP